MRVFVTLLLSHGELQEVKSFKDEPAAQEYAATVVRDRGFTERSHGDKNWLGDWGDEDGCAMVIAASSVE